MSVSVLGLVKSRPNYGVDSVSKCRTRDSFSEPSPFTVLDRPSKICFAYIAGELGSPISQSRILLSAT